MKLAPWIGMGDSYSLACSLALFTVWTMHQASSSVITNIQPGHGLCDDNSYILVKPYIKETKYAV